jgi:hypothetical protein
MNRRLHLLLLLACLLSPARGELRAGQPPAPPKRAALVALASGPRPKDSLKELRQGEFAELAVFALDDGARRVGGALVRQGWQVRSLLSAEDQTRPPKADEAPTEENLRHHLKGLAGLRPEDEVLVVLVGHLVALEAGGPGQGGGARLYFCPQDAQYQGLQKPDEVKPRHRLLALDDVYASLQDCPARNKLLVLVTAPATMYEPEKYKPPLCARLPRLPAPPDGLAVLSSCGEGECTSAFGEFLYVLEMGLTNGHADGAPDYQSRDGAVTADELVAFAQERVRENAGSYGRFAYPQHPQLLGRLRRGWVLARDMGQGDAGGARPAGKATKEVLAVHAFDYRRDDDARSAARGFGPRGLVKQLTRHGWETRLWASPSEPRLPPPADEAPTEVNLRRYLKGLAGLRPEDEVVVVLVGHLVALDGGTRLYFCP